MEVNFQLPISQFALLLSAEKQLSDVLFEEQRTAEYPYDLNDWAIDVESLLNNSNEAVRDDCHMNLDSDNILRLSPKGFDAKMLLNPFEEKFDLPSISVKKRDILSGKIEVVRVISKGAVQVWRVVDDTSDVGRIVAAVPLTCESHGLVVKDIILSIEQFFSVHNFIFWSALFSDNEESHEYVDCIKSSEVKVSSVKDVACIWLVSEPVHCINVMDGSICDPVEYRNLCNDINLCVDFDARLSASELRPSEYRHTEVDSRGVHCVEPTMKFEVLSDAQLPSDVHHVKSELFEDSVVSDGVGLGQHLTIDGVLAETEKKRFLTMGNSYICEFSQTATTYKLSKHQNQHVIPVRERPSLGPVVVFLDNAPELTLWQKRRDLCENVLSDIHIYGDLKSTAKVMISKPGQHYEQLICCV